MHVILREVSTHVDGGVDIRLLYKSAGALGIMENVLRVAVVRFITILTMMPRHV